MLARGRRRGASSTGGAPGEAVGTRVATARGAQGVVGGVRGSRARGAAVPAAAAWETGPGRGGADDARRRGARCVPTELGGD